MSTSQYDAIVIGARCAGSPTAMLLARKGHKVLVVDRATFPSDTVSTHLVHPPGMSALQRWGLYDTVVATGCPAIDSYYFNLGPVALTGSPAPPALPPSFGPRRTILDKILVDAASQSGAEVREAFTVEDVLVEDGRVAGIRGHDRGGATVTERARVVIGADGRNSVLARTVNPERYNEKPALQVSYYSYWSGLPLDRFEAYDRGDRAFAAWPTNDGLTLVIGGWPIAQFEENRKDFEGNFTKIFDRAPEFAERMRAGRREEKLVGASVPNYFRKPFGAGWALVGDAGYNRDFITAQGISDAFRDSEACANGVHEWLTGSREFDDVMGEYQKARDQQVMPIFEFTCQFASFQPPPPEQQQLMAAMVGNQEAMDGFARIFAGTNSPADFFSEENVGRIFAAAS